MISFPSFRKMVLFGALLALPLVAACAPPSHVVPPAYVDPVTQMPFVLIKGGTFEMGSRQPDAAKEEKPVHAVTVPAFFAGIHEVTFEQYDRYCKATGANRPDDLDWGRGNRPVINVTWDEANQFAQWLSTRTGLSFSLPSEAQWEYFARAGSKEKFWTGLTLPDNYANCYDCGSKWDQKSTAPVGSFPPNAWGIYDTVGNVLEWNLDNFSPDYTATPADGSAYLKGDDKVKMMRGGCWEYYKVDAGSAVRYWQDRRERSKWTGFRLVLAADPVTGRPLIKE